MRRRIVVCLFCILIAFVSKGQTCCTGGVPYLGSFRIPNAASGQFGINLAYAFNNNADLILRGEVITDNPSRRLVHTLILQTDYTFSDHWSASMILPVLFQNEQVQAANQLSQINNSGLGDISAWITRQWKPGLHFLALSIGVKAPTGRTNAIDPETGIAFPFSFQNGTSSWDFMINMYDEFPLDKSRKLFWINQLSAKYNTGGKNFGAHPGYRFGHTLQHFSALSYRWVQGNFLTGVFTGMAYQHLWPDVFKGGFENENTGGDWLNMNAGLNVAFTPKLNTSASFGIPVFRKVNGLQLATDYQFSLALGYIL